MKLSMTWSIVTSSRLSVASGNSKHVGEIVHRVERARGGKGARVSSVIEHNMLWNRPYYKGILIRKQLRSNTEHWWTPTGSLVTGRQELAPTSCSGSS